MLNEAAAQQTTMSLNNYLVSGQRFNSGCEVIEGFLKTTNF